MDSEFPEPEFLKLSDLAKRWDQNEDYLLNLVAQGRIEGRVYYDGYCWLDNDSIFCVRDFFLPEKESLKYLLFKKEICLDHLFFNTSPSSRFCPAKQIPEYNAVSARYEHLFGNNGFEKVKLYIERDHLVIMFWEVKRIEESCNIKTIDKTETSPHSREKSLMGLPGDFIKDCNGGGIFEPQQDIDQQKIMLDGMTEDLVISATSRKKNACTGPRKYHTRFKNGLSKTIGVIVELLLGKYKIKLPCTTNKALIDGIYKNNPLIEIFQKDKVETGLAKGTLEKCFSAAKKIRPPFPEVDDVYMNIIGVLLELIRGNDSEQKPPFSPKEKLVAAILKNLSKLTKGEIVEIFSNAEDDIDKYKSDKLIKYWDVDSHNNLA